MKRILSIFVLLLALTTVKAGIHWGLRGGYNISTLSFSENDWSTDNRNGFYVGPTLKIGVLGLGLDASLIYDQRTINSTQEEGNQKTLITDKRKAISLPLNLRYSFGLASGINLFVFAGPQFDFCLNKDIEETSFQWKWEQSTWTVNVGFGVTLLNHVEVRANYNIPCNDTFTFNHAFSNTVDGINCKTGAWQLGAAIYF